MTNEPETPAAPAAAPARVRHRGRPVPAGPPMRRRMAGPRPARPECDAVEWYRREICQRFAHTHGEEGELDCALEMLNLARAWRRDHSAPGPDWCKG